MGATFEIRVFFFDFTGFYTEMDEEYYGLQNALKSKKNYDSHDDGSRCCQSDKEIPQKELRQPPGARLKAGPVLSSPFSLSILSLSIFPSA